MKHVGILGGTFDPPHLGHLLIAEEVRIALGLTEVWFIPSYEPPHKRNAMTSAADRMKMLQLAITDNPFFHIDSIEVDRLGKSYTIDTMKLLDKRYPDTEFYFIIGADMVEYLPHWNRINELVKWVKFVGVKREGYELETDYSIITLDIPMFDISSSVIRNRRKNKTSIRYLLPKSVEAYIKENHLYEN